MLKRADNDPVADRFKIKDGDTERNVFVGVSMERPTRWSWSRPVATVTRSASWWRINMDEQVLAGIAVTTHKETPGLGAEAKNNPAFAAQFKGKPITSAIQVTNDGGEISALSGATITSRAVCKGTMDAIGLYNTLKPQLVEKLEGMQK
jgi:electron transport complex protein RnfG